MRYAMTNAVVPCAAAALVLSLGCGGEAIPMGGPNAVGVDYRTGPHLDYGTGGEDALASDPDQAAAEVAGDGQVANLVEAGGGADEGGEGMPPDDGTSPDAPAEPGTTWPDSAGGCVDLDGDGHGPGCAGGPDCDDENPYFTFACPDCSKAHAEGCPCEFEGQSESCYSGDHALLGKGACKNGVRKCESSHWTGCIGEVLPLAEVCDGLDNDCDGDADEGVLNECGTCDKVCEVASTGPGGDRPFDPTAENSSPGVVLSPEGFLTLAESSANLHFIWIANSAEDTVSRLDTKTGCEVARYQVCDDPSRTAVDKDGNGIITCRGDGRVAKVSPYEKTCVDRNSNGKIETSRDADGSCTISPQEMVAGDECVLWNVIPDGDTIARAAGVDKDNHPWVGFWNSRRVRRLAPADGNTVAQFDVSVRPYGLAVGPDRAIWIASRDPYSITRLDPDTGVSQTWNSPNDCYGIVVDAFGYPWIAGWGGHVLHRFDPASKTFSTIDVYPTGPRGLAASVLKDATGKVVGGKVYAAHCGNGDGSNRMIAVVDAKTLKVETPIDIGFAGCPVGVSIDSDGNLWTVNQSTSNATKINTATKKVIGTYPVGNGPYTYSDMTGAFFHKDIVPEGTYRIVYEGPALDPYMAEWYEVRWERVSVEYVAPPGTSIRVRARTACAKQDLAGAAWSAPAGPFPPAKFPLAFKDLLGAGAAGPGFLELEVILDAADDAKPYVKKVTVQYGAKLKGS